MMVQLIFAAALTVSAPESVRIAGAIGEGFERCLKGNVFKLNLEKDFFPPFVKRENTGGFIGLGKHADAAVHYAANTRTPEAIAHKEKVISFIIDNQLADGYTGCMKKEARLSKSWDIHEMGFIIQGLVADYKFFGNEKALEAARKNVDYIMNGWSSMPDNWEITGLTDRETTLGFGKGVADLYDATKDEKYRQFLIHERALLDWNQPIVIGRDKMIYGQAYGYTGTCLEQLALYRYDSDERYLAPSLRFLDFQTKGDGVLITGNGGICECCTDDQDGEGQVGETCNATFELLFWDELFRLGVADRALLGDLMERCIYNSLFAAMSADGRKLRYYTPLCGDRKFWPDDLYCCPNNFRRGMSRLPEYVFYQGDREIYANLYTAAKAEFDFGGEKLKIVEETDYPKSGKVKFTFDAPGKLAYAFKVRIPRWAKRSSIKINGKAVPYKYNAGEYVSLPKVWKKGDVVELDFPMEVKTVLGRKRQSGRFAVMRGPVVYAMNTHSVKALEKEHPHDAQTVLMMDPNQLSYNAADGSIGAVISTVDWAVGITDLSVDGDAKGATANKFVERVILRPYAEDGLNLTYFRAPNIKKDCREQDELFVPSAR